MPETSTTTETAIDSPQPTQRDYARELDTSLPPLACAVSEYVHAAFSGLVIETDEPDDAFVNLDRLTSEEGWQLRYWSLAEGLVQSGDHAGDPIGALSALEEADGRVPVVIVLRGYHRFLQSPEVVSHLERWLHVGKTMRATIVILAPVGSVELPLELRPLFVTLNHGRPDRLELEQIAREIAIQQDDLEEAAVPRVLDAAAGMTRHESEAAFALSLVRHGQLLPAPLWQLKTAAVRSTGLMTLTQPTDGFAALQGLDALKAFCVQSLQSPSGDARGVMLLSPPGCGKSQFAQALGAETGRPVLSLDMGRLLGSLVGESERNLRQALAQAESMSPVILLIDEVEKAISTGGDRDSGVSSRLLGALLTWMQERSADVYIVMTSNDARRLPPELTRAERLDATFFVDLPETAVRNDIWRLYLGFYNHNPDAERPQDVDWTGAEIRSCCRIARLLGISIVEAARFVVPIAVTAETRIERLRSWASGRTLDAHSGGPFQSGAKASNGRRSVSPRPSDN